MSKLGFDCPHCKRHLQVDESQRGRTVSCPSCRGSIRIPERQGPPQTAPARIDSGSSSPLPAGQPDITPLLVIKPVFIGWVMALPMLLYLIPAVGIFVGGRVFLVRVGENAKNPEIVPWVLGIVAGFYLLVTLGSTAVRGWVKKRTYAKTEYRFYRDHLEYAQGFWTVTQKSLSYDKIAEAAMRQGIVQRMCGLGTILLMPAGAGVQLDKSGFGGISITDVANPEEVYQTLQKLLRQ